MKKFLRTKKVQKPVIPAKAGIQSANYVERFLDTSFRWYDITYLFSISYLGNFFHEVALQVRENEKYRIQHRKLSLGQFFLSSRRENADLTSDLSTAKPGWQD